VKAIFESFNHLKALIIGDVMIDAYYFGKVDRISPEAPVPVVALNHKETRLGGAANVALNISSMGAQPILCSVIGNDADAEEFFRLLKLKKLTADGIITATNRQTTVKTRVIGNNHQMLRIDQEVTKPLDEKIEAKFISRIIKLMKGADVIIFSDYDKGVLSAKLITEVIAAAEKNNIPTIVDPKRRHFLQYKHATLFKPNLKELADGLKLPEVKPEGEQLETALKKLQRVLHNKISMTTLSEHGIYITDGKESHHLPAHIRTIADVSGAGDSVVSVAALCLALHLPLKDIALLSNLAGGLVCEEIGVVPVNKKRLLEEANKFI
jgi:rfaE bifunctional protein kinase chain/domain